MLNVHCCILKRNIPVEMDPVSIRFPDDLKRLKRLQVDLVRTYHRTRRTLLNQKEHHCVPPDDIRTYVTCHGAWVWVLENPMILLRPFQVERREGSVSWVKLDQMTMTLVGGNIFEPFPEAINYLGVSLNAEVIMFESEQFFICVFLYNDSLKSWDAWMIGWFMMIFPCFSLSPLASGNCCKNVPVNQLRLKWRRLSFWTCR